MHDDRTETVSAGELHLRSVAEVLPRDTAVAGRYAIESVLGVGGSSVVYRAHDRLLRRTVALKLLRADRLTPAALKRLQREVAVAQQVATPHVVRIFDVGDSEHGSFLTMEFVEGETLRERIARGPLPVDDAIAIGRQLLSGLEALHLVGVVHRDVKPGNVLIDLDGCVKLVDLGLARDVADDGWRATQTDGVVGTFEYVPPEQLLGKHVDARSDLYAFGVVMYECLTGDLPFGNRSSVSAAIAHLRERPTDIREQRDDIPRWLRRVIAQLLEKQPSNRFGSAAEVGRLLERRRAPLVTPATLRRAAMTIAVLLVAGVAAFMYTRTRREHDIRLTERGQGGALGVVDADGRLLWERDDLSMRASVLARRGEERVVVSYLPDATALLVLDARTGAIRRRVPLPPNLAGQGSIFFADFAPQFHATSAFVADVDHDGFDEAYVSLVHTYYPCYIAQFDTRTERLRLAFVSSGHHRVVGTLDVNADGRDDLIVAGFANRLGWFMGVGAVDVRPLPATVDVDVVRSPDLETTNSPLKPLWYTLLPPAHLGADAVRVDRDREVIVVQQENDTRTIGLDGFLVGSGEPAESALRAAARREAYAELRRARRVAAGGDWERARVAATNAVAYATKARERQLTFWAERCALRYMIREGRVAEAEARAEVLGRQAEQLADVSFDVARELHLVGDLTRAVAWYRRGIFNDVPPSVGRLRYEFVEGAVLAAIEAGHSDVATQLVTSYEREFPDAIGSATYEAYIRWRTGGASTINTAPLHSSPLDQALYWAAEIDFAKGTPPVEMLRRVRKLESSATTVLGLLQSLDAEILERLGRHSEARAAAASAVEWVQEHRGTDVLARAHADLVRQRFARMNRQ